MTKITESAIEKFTIDLLEKAGYHYIYGPTIALDGETPERESFEDVLLIERLQKAIGRINPTVPQECREDAVKQIHNYRDILIIGTSYIIPVN
jgi:type I restriction enzyme R subunit